MVTLHVLPCSAPHYHLTEAERAQCAAAHAELTARLDRVSA